MVQPDGLYYTKHHQWVRQSEGIGVVGITNHAQKRLGEIVFADLPHPGTKVEQGSAIGSVESAQAFSEIFASVSGEIVEINEALASAPQKINDSPEQDGWLVKIRLEAPE